MSAYSYACADCEGMEACPGKMTAETETELVQLIELHAKSPTTKMPVNGILKPGLMCFP